MPPLRFDNPRDAAVAVDRRLAGRGHVAYLAGGCVRDTLLGLSPKDYDVATDATPEQVRPLFPGARLVGEAFGVVTVPTTVAGRRSFVEVATFRMEWGYSDGRRPDRVQFTDAEHDARRRDFTVNGLFEDPLDERLDGPAARGPDGPVGGRIIDFVGGVADLRARVIRAIGDPHERFGEDYLRMLRAARFAARLGFDIEPGTARAVRASAGKLGQISRERIGQELRAMLTGPAPARAAQLTQALKLDASTFNEDHREPALPTLTRVAASPPPAPHAGPSCPHEDPGSRSAPPTPAPPDPFPLALAAWLLDRHGPDLSRHGDHLAALRRWRRALVLSNEESAAAAAALRRWAALHDWNALAVAPRKRLLAAPGFAEGWALFDATCPDPARRAVLRAEVSQLQHDGVAPEPFVTGDDLLALGHRPGPGFRLWLDAVYDAQLDGRVRSRAEALELLAQNAPPPRRP